MCVCVFKKAHATRTGNPLVDSVAEHQPSSPGAYYQFLDRACFLAPFGLVPLFRSTESGYPTSTGLFAVLFAGATYFFSMKMSRLMIFMGQVTSLLPPSNSGFVNPRTLMGCTNSLSRGVAAPHQCPLSVR